MQPQLLPPSPYPLSESQIHMLKEQIFSQDKILQSAEKEYKQSSDIIIGYQKELLIQIGKNIQDELKKTYQFLDTRAEKKRKQDQNVPLKVQQQKEDILSKIVDERNFLKDKYFKICSQNQRKSQIIKKFHQKMKSLCRVESQLIQLKHKTVTQTQSTRERIKKLKAQQKEIFQQKIKLNNALQKSRGNIRVYCRIKPFFNQPKKLIQGKEKPSKMSYEIGENSLTISRIKNGFKSKNQVFQNQFVLDRIFGENISQSDLFDELKQLVQCSLYGNNVCIFAYGETGSGKTYTMKGEITGNNTEHNRGFIPRSLDYLFKQAEVWQKMGQGYRSQILVSISQIYRQKWQDLLANKYVEDAKDLFYKPITNSEASLHHLNKTLQKRKICETQMNSKSSRSHLIFQLKNFFENEKDNVSRASSLVLIDLAGSENNKKSKAQGEALKQAISINMSLTDLKSVIQNISIGNNKDIIYNGSKLTLALKPYLNSDSKTVMLLNISSDNDDVDQTIRSLRFAENVRDVKRVKRSRSSDQIPSSRVVVQTSF